MIKGFTMRYLILLAVFLTTYSSSVCNSTLDLGGKSIVNLGLPIDDTSAVPFGILDDFYPTAGHSYYLNRFISPGSLTTMGSANAHKYCYSLKNSDIIKSDDGLYYIMDPAITSSTILNRGEPGDGWGLISTTDMMYLDEQVTLLDGIRYSIVENYGKLNKKFHKTDNKDGTDYFVLDTNMYKGNSNSEEIMVYRFHSWSTQYMYKTYNVGRASSYFSTSDDGSGFFNTLQYVRCSK